MPVSFVELREFVSREGRTVRISGANGEATFSPEHPDGTGLTGTGKIALVLESVLYIWLDGRAIGLSELDFFLRKYSPTPLALSRRMSDEQLRAVVEQLSKEPQRLFTIRGPGFERTARITHFPATQVSEWGSSDRIYHGFGTVGEPVLLGLIDEIEPVEDPD